MYRSVRPSFRLASVLGFVCASLTLPAAAAAADGSIEALATLGGFRLEVIDLNPADGLAPGFRLLSGAGTNGYAALYSASASEEQSFGDGSPGPDLAPGEAGIAGDGYRANSIVGGDGSLDGSFARSAVQLGADMAGPIWWPSDLFASTSLPAYGYRLELTPHTRLTWRGDMSVQAGTTGTLEPDQVGEARAWATAGMVLSSDGRTRTVQHEIQARSGGIASIADRFELSLEHQGDGYATVDLLGNAAAQAQLFLDIPAIPEPGTGWSALAGLAAVGVVLRRRRRED